MNEVLDKYIETRCEKELQNSIEYSELQNKMLEAYKNNDICTYSELSIKMQIVTEKICYKTAIKDIICLALE